VSEALRSVFLEMGFDIPLDVLERANKKVDETAAKAKKAAKAADEGSRKQKGAAQAQAGAAKQAGDTTAKATDKAAKGATKAASADDRLSKMLRVVGIDAKGASERLEAFGGKANLALAAGVAALALATRAAFQFADAFAAGAEELRDTARESRVTTDDLQELRHAAVAGGVGVERMDSAVSTFGQSLRAAERWGNGTTFTLRRLGIQARDASGHIRPTGELLDEVAIAMEHIPSPTRRAMVATQLFGESGRRMLDILHTGPGGIRALREEMQALGGGVSQEAIAASREYTVATEKLSRAQDSLRSVLATTLLPVLSWLVMGLAKVGGWIANVTKGTHVLQIALIGLGVVASAVALAAIAAWGPVVAPFLLAAAAVAALVLLFDDLTTFVEGGDSALGRFIDDTFGLGTSIELAHELRSVWLLIQDVLEACIQAFVELWRAQTRLLSGDFSGALEAARNAFRSPAESTSTDVARGTVRAFDPNRPVTVPATARVAAPGRVAAGARSSTRVVNNSHRFTINGVTDPNAVAERVGQILERQAADRRDANHPTPDDEG
jgi:hypothetical protein